MSEPQRRPPTPEAYTGETIAMPKQRVQRPTNPPPRRPASPPPAAPRYRKRRKRNPLVRNIILGIVAVLVLLLVAGYFQIASLSGAVSARDVRPAAISLGSGSNMLIIGTDERVGYPGEGVRGDTLIVAHYDTFGRWANLLSIPRDTQISLLELPETKINTAYGQGYAHAEELYGTGTTPQEGGMALAATSVEDLLQLGSRGQRIDTITTINFDGFARIIDALGGVTIDVPRYILDTEYPTEDFGVQTVEFQPGVQRMDGERALIYARTRHDSSDFDRASRQQQVMRAIVDEAKAKGPVGLALIAPQLRESLQGAVTTTLPFARPDQLLGMLWLASGLNPDEIGEARLSPEIDPNYLEVGSNLIWSEGGIGAAVDALLARPSPAAAAQENATIQVLNGTDVSGLASKISGDLEDAGFTVIPAGNAGISDASETVVYDISNKPQTARAVAGALGARYQQGAPEGVETSTDIVVILGQDAAQ